jgi:hypothetical protein
MALSKTADSVSPPRPDPRRLPTIGRMTPVSIIAASPTHDKTAGINPMPLAETRVNSTAPATGIRAAPATKNVRLLHHTKANASARWQYWPPLAATLPTHHLRHLFHEAAMFRVQQCGSKEE